MNKAILRRESLADYFFWVFTHTVYLARRWRYYPIRLRTSASRSIYRSDDIDWGRKLSWEDMTQRFLQDAIQSFKSEDWASNEVRGNPEFQLTPSHSLTQRVKSSCYPNNCHQYNTSRDTSCNRPIRYKGPHKTEHWLTACVPQVGSEKEKIRNNLVVTQLLLGRH